MISPSGGTPSLASRVNSPSRSATAGSAPSDPAGIDDGTAADQIDRIAGNPSGGDRAVVGDRCKAGVGVEANLLAGDQRGGRPRRAVYGDAAHIKVEPDLYEGVGRFDRPEIGDGAGAALVEQNGEKRAQHAQGYQPEHDGKYVEDHVDHYLTPEPGKVVQDHREFLHAEIRKFGGKFRCKIVIILDFRKGQSPIKRQISVKGVIDYARK